MKRRRPRRHETRLLLAALAAGAPALAIALVALARWRVDDVLRATLAAIAVGAWAGGAIAVRELFTRPVQTLSNLLGALREGDTSLRARATDPGDALGLAMWEINALAAQLQQRRFESLEATSLLRQVLESIDVALFAFDPEGRLRLLNAGAEGLLGRPAEWALGRDAAGLGLEGTLEGETPRLVDLRLPGGMGRWELRRGAYRTEGRPHHLVVLSDLSRALREEERDAWMRLIRVLGHEINNSLAPIQSIAGSLRTALERGGPEPEDLRAGLRIVESRSQSLGRFLNAYTRIARLPAPERARLDLDEVVRRVAALETRLAVGIDGGPALVLWADPDQFEQLLINLVRNAADAALETGGGVRIRWSAAGDDLALEILDDGPGIPDTTNLFVPFFTTKPEGSGIGLAISRQIAEAHGGTVALENRPDGAGCVARVRLPGAAPPGGPPDSS